MGKVVICVIGLVVGLVGGVVFGGALLGGAGAGIGVATGASAGICLTLQAAEEEGLLTSDQIDQVMTRAAADMAEISGQQDSASIVGVRAECAAVIQNLRTASEG